MRKRYSDEGPSHSYHRVSLEQLRIAAMSAAERLAVVSDILNGRMRAHSWEIDALCMHPDIRNSEAFSKLRELRQGYTGPAMEAPEYPEIKELADAYTAAGAAVEITDDKGNLVGLADLEALIDSGQLFKPAPVSA